MSMHKKPGVRQILILGGTLFSIVAAWYAWWIRPQQVRVETLQNQIKSVMRQVQAATVQASQLETLKSEVSQLQQELADLEKRLYPREEVPGILRRLVRLGERYRLRFSAVYPMYEQLLEETASDGSPLLILPVDLQLSGEFFQFGRYIEQLDKQPFLFSVEQVDMVVTRASYPLIEVTVRGNLYLRQSTKTKRKIG